MDIITSKDNSKVKYIKSLSNRKNRLKEQSFIVEGIKFVKEAIEQCAEIKLIAIREEDVQKIEICEIMSLLSECSTDCIVCSNSIFDIINDTVNTQGILAVVSKKTINDEDLFCNYKLIVLCDRIQDPGNLGTVIRTVDAFGPGAVILNKGCVDPCNPKVVRATAGAMFRVPLTECESTEDVIDKLKKLNYTIISTVVKSNYTFDDIKSSDRICVVIGNEGQGVSEYVQQMADMNITIRMTGRAESLNASVAAGICIYEIRKKLL